MADDAYGIQEIVTDAISIPPCQYGILQWKADGSMEYSTESVDVSAWARRTGQENTDLLNFETWSEEYLQKLISDQIGGVVRNVGSDVKRSMAETYADVYIDYYAGRKIDAKGIRTSEGYTWWERNLPDSYLIKELNAMINDADRDNNFRCCFCFCGLRLSCFVFGSFLCCSLSFSNSYFTLRQFCRIF